ncbi:MAG: DUF2085 domain-containing protein [Chloroflexota bacterium]
MADTPPKKQPVTGWQRDLVIRIDLFLIWFTKHWVGVFNTILGIYVGLPILAPTLMYLGITGPARLIYRIYSPFCHQSASRSFFLYGEQLFYPSEVADSSFTPLQAFTPNLPEFAGVDVDNFFQFFEAARRFLGNAEMGYKTAICARDMGIYMAIFLTGLLYAFLRRRIKVPKLSWIMFVIIAILPIGWDGFSQLFGYYAELTNSDFFQTIFPTRESTPVLRTTTGILFGFGVVWLMYPNLETGMVGTRYELRRKLIKAGVLKEELGPAPWEIEIPDYPEKS